MMFLFFLDCSLEQIQSRIKYRYEQALKNNEPVRKNDLPEKFSKRLQGFQEFTLPLITELQKRGNLITINANRTIEEIAHEIQEKVKD
jgi:adenylate kinase family enzyme